MLIMPPSRRALLRGAAAGLILPTGLARPASAWPRRGISGGSPPPDAILVSNHAELDAAIYNSANAGKTLLLAPNVDFGSQGIYGRDYSANPITIWGQSGSRFSYLEIDGSKGVNLKNFNVYGAYSNTWSISVNNSDAIYFTGVTINSGTAFGTQTSGTGIQITNIASGKTVQFTGQKNAAVADIWGRGNAIKVLDSYGVTLKDITISNNNADHVLLQGMHNGLVDGLLAVNPYDTDPTDHPDFIQGAAGVSTDVCSDVIIQNCGYQRTGTGTGSQGYFFEGGLRITVRKCWWHCGLGNATAFSQSDTLVVDDNFLQMNSADNSTTNSAVNIRFGSTNATITNNQCGGVYLNPGEGASPGLVQSNNTTVSAVSSYTDYSALDAWLAAHPTARARL